MDPSKAPGDGPAWADKKFRSDVRPHMRNLAEALQSLCRQLLPNETDRRIGKRITQAKAAARIYRCESSLSRFLSGQSMPDLAIVEALHREACHDAGGELQVGITLDELRLLHKRAEAEQRHSGDEQLAAEVGSLAERLRAAESECAVLRQEVTALRAAVKELKATRAGLHVRLAAQTPSGPLPVPRRRGDRQRMRTDVAAVRSLAAQAGKLDTDGRAEAALKLLRRSTEVLNPLETAGVLLLLRQQRHDELADNLIHVYGRDQGDRDVLHIALALYEKGSASDVGAILHAALE